MEKEYNFNLNSFLKDLRLKKQYINKLQNKLFLLNQVKEKNYKNLNNTLHFSNPSLHIRDSRVLYIINIQFSKSNTLFHITDFRGNLCFFCSAGCFSYKGRRKRNRLTVLKSFFYILVTKLKFLEGKPLALHLKNVNSNKFWITKQLKTKFFIKVIRNFNFYPYNGCRKSKVRRKKYKKKLTRRNG